MRKKLLVQHIKDEGHGDPEEAGVNVRIELKYPEPDLNVDQIEWSTLHDQDNVTLETDIAKHYKTITIPDETGKPIQFQIVDDHYELSPETLNQAFQLQGDNVDDILAGLL